MIPRFFCRKIDKLTSGPYNKMHHVSYAKFDFCTCTCILFFRGGDAWSEKAGDLFEELSHAAQWKIVMARICGYHNNEDGKTIPVVDLIDTAGAKVSLKIPS